ncbi:hypothetical protein HRJ35_14850 [Shewanella oneidensis MR-1]|uniref:Mu phage uncharacterized protein n=1 Tax=Shewanella oneidensis (strain ATCC 700550 / JCM 31522 / CIP 106686 / LMG 19005 / NCIMB 14063 / MR-1) TaxID=211586 RepID=Q8EDT5_SHEON|nr:phage protein [Shewanella oneidensis]AAN55686.1 Mu phage uncharacterized protein [Shewanella oneidensis MR-1]MDX5995673.1 hypothetical protein [Shewanella oneidensis]MEE2026276.1 hypothetical protein [Shewanella oneidensis]QKG97160.1 hypothetical protein HRJ35_14850 [Shewanella oneidensis MR-1]
MQALAQNGATKTVIFKGKAIEVDLIITNRHGKPFAFDRVAVEVRGGFCLDQMRDDEIIVAPGLIYREMHREVKEA